MNKETKNHLLKLIDWLFNEVISAGGDGDALWYSKHYSVEEILPLVEQFNNSLKFKWKIEFNKEEREIYWYDNQEGLLITNKEELFNNRPKWQQCTIVT